MISIVIPAFNEAAIIKTTLEYLYKNSSRYLLQEIIVIDGGSTDGTALIAGSGSTKVFISPKKGRAAQMNYGA
ncbi:MAG: glycosyltransferase, partial [Gloeobacteraceae cyanobacterium ES-bin-316]|nr:glycosyltransferase [Ferruginibacter sp.]